MNRFIYCVMSLIMLGLGDLAAQSSDLQMQVESSLQKAVVFFHSLNVQGGYGYYVTPDLSLRWGESPLDTNTIEVQPPGTPAIGQSFLRIYEVTGDENSLMAAMDAAQALIRGQNKHGGWDHTINFQDLTNERVSFDDNQTQSAVSFLMALDQKVDDPHLSQATRIALDMMITTQLSNGGWPHQYPKRGNYHDYATFNDGGINDCIRVLIEAFRHLLNQIGEKIHRIQPPSILKGGHRWVLTCMLFLRMEHY